MLLLLLLPLSVQLFGIQKDAEQTAAAQARASGVLRIHVTADKLPQRQRATLTRWTDLFSIKKIHDFSLLAG